MRAHRTTAPQRPNTATGAAALMHCGFCGALASNTGLCYDCDVYGLLLCTSSLAHTCMAPEIDEAAHVTVSSHETGAMHDLLYPVYA